MSYYESKRDAELRVNKRILEWAINWAKNHQTQKQKKLAAKHGTLKEFAKACETAFINGDITADEMLDGVTKYKEEWDAAGL